ncbi:MAG TPA: biopolymer transporter ExbD [Sandaracinaceae bacterium LLY-WYZ-13_1]|nr:biopolymer transporter ExbD [Sandaracinaceae bacterium LLY-WYZ-13_1]
MRLRSVLAALALLGCGSGPTCGEGTELDEARNECVRIPDDEAVPPPVEPLPVGEATPEVDLRITLQADGSYLLGTEPLEPETLRGRVGRRVAAANDPVEAVLVTPDGIGHDRVVDALDLLRGAGVARIALQTAAPEAR